jgi:hypothetical protein
VIPGVLRDGRHVDVFTGGSPVTWEKPASASAMYRNERRRKFMTNLARPSYEGYRRYYGRYLCRSWNRSHAGPDQLMSFDITFVAEETQPDNQPSTPAALTLWKHWCFEMPKDNNAPASLPAGPSSDL